MTRPPLGANRAFTLLEVVLAGAISAVIFAAIFGVFSSAIHLRNDAAERTRQTQLRARAVSILGNDLRQGYISGGILAATLTGSRTSQLSRFPGDLRFTTTTAHLSTGSNTLLGQNGGDTASGDVQEVEYYIVADPAGSPDAGNLIRVVSQDLLTSIPQIGRQDLVLPNVTAFEVSFYDGQTWAESWDAANSGNSLSSLAALASATDETETPPAVALPQAIRVRITQAPTPKTPHPLPLELIVPWQTQPSIPTTTSTSTTGT